MAESPSREQLGCNPFLILDAKEPETPRRLYAVLDQAELEEESGLIRLVFSAIDAGYFNEMWPIEIEPVLKTGDFRAAYRHMRIFLVEIKLSERALRDMAGQATVRLGSFDQQGGKGDVPGDLTSLIRDMEGRWKLMEIGDTGAVAELYANLFGEPRHLSVASVSEPDDTEKNKLDMTDPLDGREEAAETDITDALKAIEGDSTICHVAIYDVGQGAANGLISGTGEVLAYFDFGGGSAAHRRTFPAALTQFCFCAGDVPIILSHWDHDHWSSEGRDIRSHCKTWIAPSQHGTPTKTGFHNSALIASILANGKLLLWPSAVASLSVGQATIWKCNGGTRNTSGLALVVRERGGAPSNPLLLPADAGYDDMNASAPKTFDAMVAPHHGGRSNSNSIPGASKSGRAFQRLVYSYGDPNSHGHVFQSVRTAHDGADWHDPKVSATAPAKVRNTVDRRQSTGLGHVGFDWGGGLALGRTCSNGCPLGIDQI